MQYNSESNRRSNFKSGEREDDDADCPITQAWRVQVHNYKRMTCVTVQLQLKSGLLMTNQIQKLI